MKKMMISLLMIAAALNAMAVVTYTGKVTVTLKSANNKSCAAVVATSNDLNDGLNPEYYAALNDEGKSVLLYVDYAGTNYSHFGSSAATMQNMPLIMKANSETSYRFLFSDMEGTIEIYDTEAGANIDKSQVYYFTIEEAQKNQVIADRFIINYVAPAPSYVKTLTTNAYGYASFSWNADLAVPAGLTVYKGAINGDCLDLTEMDYVKAGEGVIVYGAANTQYGFVAGSGAADYDGNDLKPTSAYTIGDQNVYVLKDNELRLYVGSTALAANKAYLQLPGGANNAPKRISFRYNATTGVQNVKAELKAEKFIENGQVLIRRGEAVYNLQGQMVR